MRKFILTTAALIGAAAVASPAMAQDTGDQSRGRLHVEAIAGYDNTKANFDVNGAVYGVGIGYDLYLGRTLTFGPDAEITTSSADECQTVSGSLACAGAGRDLYAGARIGARFGRNGQHLAYVGGGYTNARYDVTLTTGTTTVDLSDDIDGYRIKGGVELGLGQRFFARAEYRYSNYEASTERHQVVGGVGIRF